MAKRINPQMPAIVLRSVALGMLLMAILAYAWSRLAFANLPASANAWLFVITLGCMLIVLAALYFLIKAAQFPKLRTAEDMARGKKMAKWYGIIFGAEGLLIGLTCTVLGVTGHADFILPAVALIVGLHFFPMAKLFDRTIDYYIASFTCLIGLVGIYGIINRFGLQKVYVLTGLGMTAATLSYALYMFFHAVAILKARIA